MYSNIVALRLYCIVTDHAMITIHIFIHTYLHTHTHIHACMHACTHACMLSKCCRTRLARKPVSNMVNSEQLLSSILPDSSARIITIITRTL